MSHDHSTALVTQDDPHRNPVPNPGIEEHVERRPSDRRHDDRAVAQDTRHAPIVPG